MPASSPHLHRSEEALGVRIVARRQAVGALRRLVRRGQDVHVDSGQEEIRNLRRRRRRRCGCSFGCSCSRTRESQKKKRGPEARALLLCPDPLAHPPRSPTVPTQATPSNPPTSHPSPPARSSLASPSPLAAAAAPTSSPAPFGPCGWLCWPLSCNPGCSESSCLGPAGSARNAACQVSCLCLAGSPCVFLSATRALRRVSGSIIRGVKKPV